MCGRAKRPIVLHPTLLVHGRVSTVTQNLTRTGETSCTAHVVPHIIVHLILNSATRSEWLYIMPMSRQGSTSWRALPRGSRHTVCQTRILKESISLGKVLWRCLWKRRNPSNLRDLSQRNSAEMIECQAGRIKILKHTGR